MNPTPAEHAQFGKYELLAKIGSGGMAEIYKARIAGPDGFEKTLVVKKILPEHARNKAFINMLIAEAKVTSLLHHPNIVQIYELGEYKSQYYIAMEYVEGSDLLAILAHCTRERLRVPTEIALYIVSEMCKGLAHAHAATDANGRALNIIHRDVSPSNILVSFHGDVKIMDFGVARADLGRAATIPGAEPGVLKGKLGYMSPAQVAAQPLDRRSDIFALGIILFECLTLKRLFVGKTDVQTLLNIRESNIARKFKRHSYIPHPIRTILRRALARDPSARFQTATDFQEAILDHLFESRMRVSARSVANFLHQVLTTAPDAGVATSSERPLGNAPSASGGARSTVTYVDVDASDERRSTASVTESDTEITIPELPVSARSAVSTPSSLRRVDLSHATFHLRNDEDVIFGPIDLERLSSLIEAGCVSAGELISINGSDWMVTGDLRALVDIHPQLNAPEHERPLHDGPVNQLRTPNLLHQLFSARAAGKLKLTRGSIAKEVYFQKGVPVFVTSTIKSELFGRFLIDRGIVSEAEVAAAVEEQSERHTHLGSALVDAGVLSVMGVQDAVRRQFKQRVLEVFSWNHGWYEFFEGILPSDAIVLPDLATPQLIMEGIRRHYDLPTLRAIFADYRERPIVTPSNLANSVERFELLGAERDVPSRLESEARISGLIGAGDAGDAAELALLRTTFALYQTDLLAFRSRDSRGARGSAS